MEICRRKNQIEISELDPFLAELLRQIPASANTEGAPAAEQRIFSLADKRKRDGTMRRVENVCRT